MHTPSAECFGPCARRKPNPACPTRQPSRCANDTPHRHTGNHPPDQRCTPPAACFDPSRVATARCETAASNNPTPVGIRKSTPTEKQAGGKQAGE
ncbi:hypothetical protein FRC08_004667 [Ceratobasidium sp. 394]|nr:hypothetical protein FRC08_004667 [Ceratobasidium sp. 394]